MKSAGNIVSGIHHFRMSYEHFTSFELDHPGTKGANLFKQYKARIEWIVKDMITHPLLPKQVTDGIKKEWESDVFAIPAIEEKIALLNPEQRETVELMIDQILKGETITVEITENNNY